MNLFGLSWLQRFQLKGNLTAIRECSAFYLMITQLDMSNFITMVYRMYVFSELLGWIYIRTEFTRMQIFTFCDA